MNISACVRYKIYFFHFEMINCSTYHAIQRDLQNRNKAENNKNPNCNNELMVHSDSYLKGKMLQVTLMNISKILHFYRTVLV